MCRSPHGRATAGPMPRHCSGASFAARGQRCGRRTGDPWGGAAFGDSPLLPGAPTPLTRGGSREHSGQLPHRFLLRPRIRMQLANGGLKAPAWQGISCTRTGWMCRKHQRGGEGGAGSSNAGEEPRGLRWEAGRDGWGRLAAALRGWLQCAGLCPTVPGTLPAGPHTRTTTARASSSATPTSPARTSPTTGSPAPKVEIGEAALATLYYAASRPFAPPTTGQIAVKVINHYRDEVLKVYEVDEGTGR